METQMLTPTPGAELPRTWNEFLTGLPPKRLAEAFLKTSGGQKASSAHWRQRWRCAPRQPHPPDVPLMPVPRHSDIWNHLDKTRTPLRVWLAAASY